jgi:hypothetical protein
MRSPNWSHRKPHCLCFPRPAYSPTLTDAAATAGAQALLIDFGPTGGIDVNGATAHTNSTSLSASITVPSGHGNDYLIDVFEAGSSSSAGLFCPTGMAMLPNGWINAAPSGGEPEVIVCTQQLSGASGTISRTATISDFSKQMAANLFLLQPN